MGIDPEIYRQERAVLIDAEKEMAKSFDKSILTLSAGSFGLTITFITKIVSVIASWSILFLGIAWVAFTLSMLSTLISFLTGQEGCRRQRDILDEALKDKFDSSKHVNEPAQWTNSLNIISIAFFILGALSLIVFSLNNIPKGGDQMILKGKNLENGFVAQKVPVDLKEGFVAQRLPAAPVEQTGTIVAQSLEASTQAQTQQGDSKK